MPITETTTRTDLVRAAAFLAYDGERVPFWDESEYVRGLCELIADATGSTDLENAKTEAWEAMRDAMEQINREDRANAIAREVFERHIPKLGDPTDADIREALALAALRGMTEREGQQ